MLKFVCTCTNQCWDIRFVDYDNNRESFVQLNTLYMKTCMIVQKPVHTIVAMKLLHLWNDLVKNLC